MDRKINANLQCVIYGIVGVVSLISNIIIIIVISFSKKFRTRNNILLINLAVTDLLIIVVGIPFTILNLKRKDSIPEGGLCTAFGYLILVAFNGSNFNLMLIAVHRYVLIAKKNIYNKMFTKKRMILFTLSSWIVSLMLSAPPIFGWGKFEYDIGRAHCMIIWGHDEAYLLCVQIISFTIPLSTMIFCYYKIIMTTIKARKRLTASCDKHQLQRTLVEQRLTVMLLLVVITFFACFMPYAVLVYGEGFFNWKTPEAYSFFAMIFAYSNSMYDFWIYSVMSKKFRLAFKRILKDLSRQRRRRIRPQLLDQRNLHTTSIMDINNQQSPAINAERNINIVKKDKS